MHLFLRITQVNLICDTSAEEPVATALGDSFDKLLFYVRTLCRCTHTLTQHCLQEFNVRTKCACPGACSGGSGGGVAAGEVGLVMIFL